jgi:hypothetical protein
MDSNALATPTAKTTVVVAKLEPTPRARPTITANATPEVASRSAR